MRFIGNKANLVDTIYQTLIAQGVSGESFFDVFSGTTSVSSFFKKKDYSVISSDLLYFSYVLQKAYISNNETLNFNKLLPTINVFDNELFSTNLQKVIIYLNQIDGVDGFIYKNYTPSGTHYLEQPRMYFSDINGQKIDAIRQKIESWYLESLLSEQEYFCLLACLIETVPFYANISGVYAAFQKKWDVRALKPLVLRPIAFICNSKDNFAYLQDSVHLSHRIKADIFYLDPPYNQRQYAPNYHLLETIARYDNPNIKGVSGMRDYSEQKSKFCNAKTAINELESIASSQNYKYLILSYNSEGIMSQDSIISTLKKFGSVSLVEFDYLRYKSNQNGEQNKFVREQLFILKNLMA